MERTSRGIILEPDPRYKEKKPFPFKVFKFICQFGFLICWLSFVILMAMRLLRWLTLLPKDNTVINFLINIDFIFFVFAICLTPLVFLWDETKRCPYCGHFFTMSRISDNKLVNVDNKTISRNTFDTSNTYISDIHGNHDYITTVTQGKEYGVRTTKTYTYNMHCSHCGCVNKVSTEKETEKF